MPWPIASAARDERQVRAFDLDVLAYPHCGGRMRRLATTDDPLIIEPILVQALCRLLACHPA